MSTTQNSPLGVRGSKHNIIVPVKDSGDYFIVNPLYKSADFVSAEELNFLQNGLDANGEFSERNYLVEENEEKRAFKLAYLDFIDTREEDEIQLFFVPNYSCNFACSYCYQEGYSPAESKMTTEVVDAFFNYIGTQFAGRKKYITVFGGEPLLPGESQRKIIEYLLQKSTEANLDVAFVTNGYTLASYVDLLKTASIREVQVTLDGTKSVHDSRRYMKGGQSTFDKIIEGIDRCLQNNISVNLRMVADKDNLGNLPELARFAIEKGWTASPLFKTQIGRNYELHVCNSSPEKLYTRTELYERIYELIKVYPEIIEFYKPGFSIAKYIAENEELPSPLFDSCPACKTEWAFDFTGTIYSCTATVGKKGEELGTFYPVVTKNEEAISQWQDRDITTIEKCKTCEVALVCGGGCASVAKNKNGSTNAPDCRPIKELLSLGAAAYLHRS
ncbi:MAG TPA: radical SAM protein [Paludibacteraceae bacterium]|nr:radical SAM protein [Paludibacteraceae bacterium]HPT42605.1 radical SAM protein [Paludibacteraceae bacterium]